MRTRGSCFHVFLLRFFRSAQATLRQPLPVTAIPQASRFTPRILSREIWPRISCYPQVVVGEGLPCSCSFWASTLVSLSSRGNVVRHRPRHLFPGWVPIRLRPCNSFCNLLLSSAGPLRRSSNLVPFQAQIERSGRESHFCGLTKSQTVVSHPGSISLFSVSSDLAAQPTAWISFAYPGCPGRCPAAVPCCSGESPSWAWLA